MSNIDRCHLSMVLEAIWLHLIELKSVEVSLGVKQKRLTSNVGIFKSLVGVNGPLKTMEEEKQKSSKAQRRDGDKKWDNSPAEMSTQEGQAHTLELHMIQVPQRPVYSNMAPTTTNPNVPRADSQSQIQDGMVSSLLNGGLLVHREVIYNSNYAPKPSISICVGSNGSGGDHQT